MISFISIKLYLINGVKKKYASLGASYKQIEEDEKEILQFIDDILNGKTKMELSKKPLYEFSVEN